MNQDESKQVFDYIVKRCERIGEDKSKIYASDFDVLSNFYSAARYQDCTPQKALLGMMTKHLIAIKDFINIKVSTDIDLNEWEEKIIDSIVYPIRLYEIIIEESKTISMFKNQTKMDTDIDSYGGEI